MRAIITAIAFIIFIPVALLAQGSIYGTVDLSTGAPPASGELRFFGYLNGTDNEIRLKICDGAGYDGSNWWDDFQNYLDEAPGIPYRYLFFATSALESYDLSSSVPNNSFQQEDITLAAGSYPPAPAVVATAEAGSVRLNWTSCTGCSYHVYRRPSGVTGSFFRIDNPSGDLSTPGLADATYLDPDISSLDQYEYLVIARQADGTFSAPSDPVVVSAGICGDADGSGGINIGDAVYMINYIFAGGPAPLDPHGGDVDCSGQLNIGDAVYLVNYIFAGGPAPCSGC
jgi:hypothetical protein